MLDKLFPIEHVKRIEDIDYERLVKAGYSVFIFDYDFTLAPWKTIELDSETVSIFEKLKHMGVEIFVMTNAKFERVEHLKKKLPWIEVHWSMGKPSIKKMKKILNRKGINPKKVVIIGDLFLTDILAGNRLGMYTIMVNPRLYEAKELYKWIVGGLSVALYRTLFFFFGWIFRLASLASPNEWVKDVKSINYDRLVENGFEVFVFDFDNTLAPWRSSYVPEDHVRILENLKRRGVKVLIASNGKKRDVDLPFKTFWRVGKPIALKLRRYMKERRFDFKRTVVVGDQLFTDVLFGNLIGAYTIKTQPLKKEEAFVTKINRLFEKIFSKLIVDKPKIDDVVK